MQSSTLIAAASLPYCVSCFGLQFLFIVALSLQLPASILFAASFLMTLRACPHRSVRRTPETVMMVCAAFVGAVLVLHFIAKIAS
jgi:hypothetical protein